MISCASSFSGNEVAQLLLAVHGLGERHADFERNQLRQPIRQPERLVLHPRHVAHHGLRGHRAEGDDLAHRVVAVEFGDVVQHFLAPFHAEIDVEVGHGHALGIEQAFEQQVVAERVEVGDAETEGHERGRAGTPAAHRNAVVPGPVDELLDDEEVPREAHLVDDAEFVVQAVPVARHVQIALGRGQLLEMALQTGAAALVEQRFLRAVLGHRRMRQMVLAQLDFAAAALGDLHGVLEGFGQVGKQRQHLGGTAQVLLFAVARSRRESSSTRPSWMQTRVSCASKSSRSRKRTSLVATRGMPCSAASCTASTTNASSPGRPARTTSR